MNLAGAIVKSYAAWERKPADFYPTPPDVTQGLLDVLRLPPGASIWEPACGEGAISHVLSANGHFVTSTDLRHTGFGRGGLDFLAASPGVRPDAIVTNPPFRLADAFIRKALDHAPIVAMLLKSSYWHAKGRIPLFEQHPPKLVYALTWRPAFLEAERGGSPLMDCVWCVWKPSERPGTLYALLRRPAVFPALPPPSLPVRLARLAEAAAENAALRQA